MTQKVKNEFSIVRFRKYFWVIALLPFIVIPLLGSQFYFRHDDSAQLLWAKEFNQPFYHAFSTDPEVNRFANYPGLGPYWRPFGRVYLMSLWNIFGSNAAPYHVAAGILFLAAVFIFYQLVRRYASDAVATLSCLSLIVVFHGAMYNLFHIAVPITYFFQIVMLYCFWSFLQNQRWYYLLGMVVFLAPSMERQTTAILLMAIWIANIINQGRKQPIFSSKNFILSAVLFTAIFIMKLSPQTAEGSILSVFPVLSKMMSFLSERFFYYGSILTSGIPGLVLLLTFGGTVTFKLLQIVQRKFKHIKLQVLSILITLFLTFFLMKLQPFATYWLAFCLIYLFLFDNELRLPIAWAGASLLCFFSVNYYHNGYLVEAAFPLSMALGIVMTRLLSFATERFTFLSDGHFKGLLPVSAAVVLISVSGTILFGSRIPFLSERIATIKIATTTNKNFNDLMSYLYNNLPENAIVYELAEEELGVSFLERRFLPLRQRAAQIKVMNIEDTENMLKVLGRYDIKVTSTSQINEAKLSNKDYLIVLNNFEREIVESRFNLTIVKEFRGDIESAVIYRFEPQDLSSM